MPLPIPLAEQKASYDTRSLYHLLVCIAYMLRYKPAPWEMEDADMNVLTLDRDDILKRIDTLLAEHPELPRMCFCCGTWSHQHPETEHRPLWNGKEAN